VACTGISQLRKLLDRKSRSILPRVYSACSGTEARKRDYIDKRADYAKAGVAEYWIVDHEESLVTVLVLTGTPYQVAQECHPGDVARSVLLSGLEIPVDQIWSLADES
jgi:Uma2 family endonuclease